MGFYIQSQKIPLVLKIFPYTAKSGSIHKFIQISFKSQPTVLPFVGERKAIYLFVYTFWINKFPSIYRCKMLNVNDICSSYGTHLEINLNLRFFLLLWRLSFSCIRKSKNKTKKLWTLHTPTPRTPRTEKFNFIRKTIFGILLKWKFRCSWKTFNLKFEFLDKNHTIWIKEFHNTFLQRCKWHGLHLCEKREKVCVPHNEFL